MVVLLSVWLLYDPKIDPETLVAHSMEECAQLAERWMDHAKAWRMRVSAGGVALKAPSVTRCDNWLTSGDSPLQYPDDVKSQWYLGDL